MLIIEESGHNSVIVARCYCDKVSKKVSNTGVRKTLVHHIMYQIHKIIQVMEFLGFCNFAVTLGPD